MVAWLDQFVTDDLIKAYVAAADAGQIEAFYYDQFVVTRIADRRRRHQRFEQFVEPGRLRAFFKDDLDFAAGVRGRSHRGSRLSF